MADYPAEDLFNTAMTRLAVRDLRNARRLLKEAANQQYIPAIRLYASFIEHGVGGRPSEHKAMIWHEKTARLGDVPACIKLASFHISNKNIPQAKYWLDKAYPETRAALMLVELYRKSRSVIPTVRAKAILQRISRNLEMLNHSERSEFYSLSEEYKNRNPDPWWSRENERQRQLYEARRREHRE